MRGGVRVRVCVYETERVKGKNEGGERDRQAKDAAGSRFLSRPWKLTNPVSQPGFKVPWNLGDPTPPSASGHRSGHKYWLNFGTTAILSLFNTRAPQGQALSTKALNRKAGQKLVSRCYDAAMLAGTYYECLASTLVRCSRNCPSRGI
eukprot:6212483-Pleurochrysis_carterae.AAC.9